MRSKQAKKHSGSGDSIWGSVYNLSRIFETTPEYVLYEISYVNLIMYASSVPSFDDEKKEDDSWDERLNWDNPDNFTDSDTDTDDTI